MVVAISVITGFLALAYVVVVSRFIAGWKRLSQPDPIRQIPSTTVSVLVCARNEEDHIQHTLKALRAQDYPADLLEIIVINDHSEDHTAELVETFSPRVKLINFYLPQAINSYKKAALELGIERSSGKLIVTTDADCTMGDQWLAGIVSCYEANQFKMISSPVAYYREKNLFERLQTLEFSFLIGMGAGSIGNAHPITCNGANLAYEREAFLAVGGFKGIDTLASGDDELLLHKIKSRFPGSIGFFKDRNSIVYTYAKATLGDFIAQRKRWASKSTTYQDKTLVYLGMVMWIFSMSILLSAFAGFFDSRLFLLALVLFLGKVIAESFFLVPVCRFFRRTDLLGLIPLLSMVHIIYLIYIGLAGNMGKYNWKGRTVK